MADGNINKKSIINITLLFGVILFSLLIILILIKVVFDYSYGINFDILSLIDSVIVNLLGITVLLLIFNVFYEYFVRIYLSDELSEKITEVILSKKEVIDAFNIKTKKQFIKNTILSMLGQEKGAVVYEMISPYIRLELNVRKEFKYTIILEDKIAKEIENCKWSSYLDCDKYNLISESLSYTKSNDNISDYISIGFSNNFNLMEKQFRDTNCIFRENLHILEDDLRKIKQNSKGYLINCMKLELKLNHRDITFDSIDVSESGIVVIYKTPKEIECKEINYKISFDLPQLKGNNSFMATICEPSYKPTINFYYPKHIAVQKILFFKESDEKEMKLNDLNGIMEIELNEWVLPRSGVVFLWTENTQ